MEALHTWLYQIVEILILFFECVGVGVLTFSGIKALIGCLRRAPDVGLHLAEGMALSLQFKLGGEILRTVIVKDLQEILTVAFIIALRSALAFLIHWEIKSAKARTVGPPPPPESPLAQ